jgi:2,3,4,5-tetrahydropyridine-2-carboxylate N-succinyltransferase
MNKYVKQIEDLWEMRLEIPRNSKSFVEGTQVISYIISQLDIGKIRVCERVNDTWITNTWIKKAILLYFMFVKNSIFSSGSLSWYDKVPPKFDQGTEEEVFVSSKFRTTPGSFIRKGAYIGPNSVIMPSFINIGSYIGSGTTIGTWATIGSCAQIGKNCRISGGVGIEGALENLDSAPVIIEDNCFIGAKSEITEGIRVGESTVIGMGVHIGASTKIIDRETKEIIRGYIPPYSVVLPGSLPDEAGSGAFINCAVIIKRINDEIRQKVSIKELLNY